MSTTESLQFAQIIADLQSLQNADANAAVALLSAHKTSTTRKLSKTSLPEPPRFDKLGRRIVAPRGMPALNRLDSSGSMSFGGDGNGKMSGESSGVGTPAAIEEEDEDMRRAKTLVQLYEMRGKVKLMGEYGLTRAKEKVDGVLSQYAQKDLEERENDARVRRLGGGDIK